MYSFYGKPTTGIHAYIMHTNMIKIHKIKMFNIFYKRNKNIGTRFNKLSEE